MADDTAITDPGGDDDVQCLGDMPPPSTTFRDRSRESSTTSSSAASSLPASSSSRASSKKPENKQVSDPELLGKSDWQIADGVRNAHKPRYGREFLELMGQGAEARSPRSSGSNSSSYAGSSSQKMGSGTALAKSEETLPTSSFDIPIRGGSGVSNASGEEKSSRTSSGQSSELSDAPSSRGVSFATFQAENNNNGGGSVSSAKIGRLTLDEGQKKQKPRENVIDLSGDDDEDLDGESVLRHISPRTIADRINVQKQQKRAGPGGPGMSTNERIRAQHLALLNGEDVEFEVEENGAIKPSGRKRESESSTPPKRKHNDAFEIEDAEEGSLKPTKPTGSRESSSSATLSRSSSDAPSTRRGSNNATTPEVILSDDEGDFVTPDDDADLSGGEELPENPAILIGGPGRPILVDDEDGDDNDDADADFQAAYFEDNEVEFLGETRLAPQRRSVAAAGGRRRSSVISYRNPVIAYPLAELESITHRGWVVKKDTFMEIKYPHPAYNSPTTFLLVSNVVRNRVTGTITLRGYQFIRAKFLGAVLPPKLNELCRILDVDDDDPRPAMQQGMIEVGLETAVFAPRELNITNRVFSNDREGPWPCTFRPAPRGSSQAVIAEKGVLCCRWTCVTRWPDATCRVKLGAKNGGPMVTYCMFGEESAELRGVDARQRKEDVRDEWRGYGKTVLGGGYIPGDQSLAQGFFKVNDAGIMIKVQANFRARRGRNGSRFRPINSSFNIDLTDSAGPSSGSPSRTPSRSLSTNLLIDLTDPTPLPPTGRIPSSTPRASQFIQRLPGQKYTYGDAFCGAGGATRGAYMAGLKPLWGFDMDTHACSSWHKNFPRSAIYCMSAFEFCLSPSINALCDILHLSPPCQFFSPAHTIAGKFDEQNSAALLAIGDVLRKARPRLATLEQTFGIMADGFKLYFNAVVNMFTVLGYGVTYKVCMLHHWGLPQRRVRLIIIASAPGELLPSIPAYTHCKAPSPHSALLPFNGVNPLIRNIRPGDPDHNLHNVALPPGKREAPWDGDSICPRAMTCAGGQNFHPSGRRRLTHREFAAIQGFPMEHIFGDVAVKKQIGNAVPPSIGKKLFAILRRSLEQSDGVVVGVDDDEGEEGGGGGRDGGRVDRKGKGKEMRAEGEVVVLDDSE